MENIVWVITVKCAGHHNHDSCCSSPNSQGTVLQYPWDFFLIFVFIFTTWEVKPMNGCGFHHHGWEGVEGGKNKIRKKKVPWVLWKGALAIGAQKAIAMVLWPVHLIEITQTMFAGDALSKSTHN